MPTLERPARRAGGGKRFVFIAIALGAIIGGVLAALLLNGSGGAATDKPQPSASSPHTLDVRSASPPRGETQKWTYPTPSSSIPHASVESLPTVTGPP
jgi:hypothetical protein